MLQLNPQSSRNYLLSALPAAELNMLSDALELVELPHGAMVCKLNSLSDLVYFPTSGIGSVVAVSPKGKRAEAGLIGREGFFPPWIAGGIARNINEITIQIESSCWVMPVPRFHRAMTESTVFQHLIQTATMAYATQVTSTALSNAIHSVEERLTRWLLMCHDRVDTNEIALTHEFIAIMLAVRRPSVTTALHMLEGRGFIRSERGLITIRNRPAMESFAADAYGEAERHSYIFEGMGARTETLELVKH
ncbi:Crp/Fnr family transcriptional regulator [Rhizobium helianthi]|uniref:Crp/Fnr family transcriptional regulator n=1 Tax=Rhizobium helianthi TaxID=1132695 RepID=A0ABW4LY00_9HYPH